MYEEIVKSLPGSLWYQPTGPKSGYWLRIAGPEHYEEYLVDILSGEMIHPSQATDAARVVSWREVMF